jgi:hypothetical protein
MPELSDLFIIKLPMPTVKEPLSFFPFLLYCRAQGQTAEKVVALDLE